MSNRTFSTREIMEMLPQDKVGLYGWGDMSIDVDDGSTHRFVYLAHEGKLWRVTAKVSWEGSDELLDEIEFLMKNEDGVSSLWEAVEVEKKETVVTKYVPVEEE